MSLHYIYSDAPLSTIDITDRCRVPGLSVKEQAEEGAVPISSLVIDDPDGDFIPVGHRRLHIYEDTAPVDNQHVFNGFVANERVARGPSGRTGASRQWTVDLSDPDVLINRRIMNGTDANRPAETDLERIQALLTMTELNTVDDDTYVNTTAATVLMDAVDYRGQNVGAYIDDCRQASGKNAFIFYNEALGQFGLWYDFATSTEYDSGMFLSNTLSEINQTTVFEYSQERTYLNKDPSRVASGIYLEYDGPDSPVYVQDATTTAAFAAIDWPAPSLNVKSLAKATARANRYLADARTEDPIIHTVMTAVPRDKVNVVLKGQLVQFKASWMPGYEEYTTCRVLYRTVTEITEDPTASFEIEMDLSPILPQCPAATETGYYPPNLSATSVGDGNIVYTHAGLAEVFVPTPGYVGDFHFATYNGVNALSHSGHCDFFGDCTESYARNFVVGDGTITCYSRQGPAPRTLRASLLHQVAGTGVLDEGPVFFAAGDSVTFNVSSEDQTICVHWVDITDTGAVCGGPIGVDGFDWVKAV